MHEQKLSLWAQGRRSARAGARQGRGRDLAETLAERQQGRTAAVSGCNEERGRRRVPAQKR